MITKRIKHKELLLTFILGMAFSQTFAQYKINNYTINNGGGEMIGGNYEMNSSIAQVDASATQTGGNYSLNGGFWHEKDNTPQPELIFTNGFE